MGGGRIEGGREAHRGREDSSRSKCTNSLKFKGYFNSIRDFKPISGQIALRWVERSSAHSPAPRCEKGGRGSQGRAKS
jgi:hypothetical protein